MNKKEREVMDHIVAAYNGIKDLNLICNHHELEQTVHHLQMFVMMSQLGRECTDPDEWNNWFDER